MINKEINTCKYSAFAILMSFRYVVVVKIQIRDMYFFMSALTHLAKHLE